MSTVFNGLVILTAGALLVATALWLSPASAQSTAPLQPAATVQVS